MCSGVLREHERAEGSLTLVLSPWGLLAPSSTQKEMGQMGGMGYHHRLKQNVSQEPQVLSEECANPHWSDRIEDADLFFQNRGESASVLPGLE